MTTQGGNGALQPPLTARDGRKLKVLAVCRISTLHQDERSLEDQEALYRGWLARLAVCRRLVENFMNANRPRVVRVGLWGAAFQSFTPLIERRGRDA